MDQRTFSEFVQGLTTELRNVACSVTNTLRGESLLKNIHPLIRKEDGGYRTWLEDMEIYFQVVRVAEEDKCQAALLTTGGAVSQYIYRLINTNSQLRWNELKHSLGEYYGVVSDPTARLVELANIKQGIAEGIHEYMQRVLRLAGSAYEGVDGRNEVAVKQVLGFFIEGIRDREIKLAVLKDEPQNLEAAYQKALSELKWKIRLDEGSKYEDEPMEICHARRRIAIEAVSPITSRDNNNKNTRGGNSSGSINNGNNNNNKGRYTTNSQIGRYGEARYRNREREKRIVRCWNCGKQGHMQRFCWHQVSGNGRGPLVLRPTSGTRMYQRT